MLHDIRYYVTTDISGLIFFSYPGRPYHSLEFLTFFRTLLFSSRFLTHLWFFRNLLIYDVSPEL